MVAVSEHHAAHTLLIHAKVLVISRHLYSGMGLITCFIDDEQPIFIRQLQIFVYGWIMGSTHCIEVKLFQYFKVFANHLFRHGMSHLGMLHVTILCIYLQGNAIEIKSLAYNLCLLETYAGIYFVNQLSIT